MTSTKFAEEFKRMFPHTRLKIGTLIALFIEMKYLPLSELDEHYTFMKRVGIISADEHRHILFETARVKKGIENND